MNALVFHLLALCQGEHPLATVLAQVAGRLGQEPDAIGPAGLAAARSLVEQGFLWPADDATRTEMSRVRGHSRQRDEVRGPVATRAGRGRSAPWFST